jgi:hypothetical protein
MSDTPAKSGGGALTRAAGAPRLPAQNHLRVRADAVLSEYRAQGRPGRHAGRGGSQAGRQPDRGSVQLGALYAGRPNLELLATVTPR